MTKLPKWVYRNLAEYGNCALPNSCNDIPIEELEKHFSKVMHKECSIRVADFVKTESTKNKKDILKHYYIVEERK